MKKNQFILFIFLIIVVLFSSCNFEPEITSKWKKDYYTTLQGKKTEEKFLYLDGVFIDEHYVSFDAHTRQWQYRYGVTIEITDIDNIVHTFDGFVDYKDRIYVNPLETAEVLELFLKGPCKICTESNSPYTVADKYFSFSTSSSLIKEDLDWLYNITEKAKWSHNYYTDEFGREISSPYLCSNYSFGPYKIFIDQTSISFDATSCYAGDFTIQIEDSNKDIYTYTVNSYSRKNGYLYLGLEYIREIKKMLIDGCNIYIFPSSDFRNKKMTIMNVKIEESDLKWLRESSLYYN